MGTKRKLTFEVTEDETTDGEPIWVVRSPQLNGEYSHFLTQGHSIDGALEMAADLLQTLKREGPGWTGTLNEFEDAVTDGFRASLITYDGNGRRVELDGAAR